MKRLPLLALTLAVIGCLPTVARAGVLEPFALRVPVLMYHRIQCEITPPDSSNGSLFLCPDDLDAQMTLLASRGWHSITAPELAAALLTRTCPPNKTFVITVDDGALDGYTNGAPIWEAHGFRATFYMVVGIPAGFKADPIDKPHFTFDQARDLLLRGHALGNHTWTHASMSGTPTQAKMDFQITQAQDRLTTELLAHTPPTFVYPYGSTSQTAVGYLAAHGYSMAFTTARGGVHSTASPLLSPRIRVSRSTTPGQLLSAMRPFNVPCTG